MFTHIYIKSLVSWRNDQRDDEQSQTHLWFLFFFLSPPSFSLKELEHNHNSPPTKTKQIPSFYTKKKKKELQKGSIKSRRLCFLGLWASGEREWAMSLVSLTTSLYPHKLLCSLCLQVYIHINFLSLLSTLYKLLKMFI